MRTKRKRVVYMMFLLITVLMFLHSWKLYVNPMTGTTYAKKHDVKAVHPINSPVYNNTHIVVHA